MVWPTNMAAMLTLRRKSTWKSTIAAAGAAAVVLAGCSSGSGGEQSLPDAAELLSASTAATKDLTSAHLEVAVTGKVPGLPVKTVTGDITNTPANAAKGTADIERAGNVLSIPFVVVDGILYGALTEGGSYSDFGKASDIYDASVILDPNDGLANMLANFTGATAEATETVGDLQTVRVTGETSAEAVNKLLPMLKADKPVKSTAWIAKDDGNKLVKARIAPDDNTAIDMTLSAWNEPVTITKPEI